MPPSDPTPNYRPADSLLSPRFSGVRTFMRLPHVTDLTGVDVAVLGFPFDTGTSFRPGARFGPEAVRSASALLRPYHPGHDVEIFSALSAVDGGDLPVHPGATESSLEAAERELVKVVQAGVLPLVIGGDHTISLAQLRALAATYGPLSLIHLDAHGDVWDEYFGQKIFHGTTFRRAAEEGLIDPKASIQAGMRGPLYTRADTTAAAELGFEVLTISQLRELGPGGYGDLVRSRVGSRPAFVSFDVDVCDPAFAPGTGTPEIGGLSSTEAQAFVRALTGANLVGCDVVEVAPAYDTNGGTTALLAANMIWELMSLVALRPVWRELAGRQGGS